MFRFIILLLVLSACSDLQRPESSANKLEGLSLEEYLHVYSVVSSLHLESEQLNSWYTYENIAALESDIADRYTHYSPPQEAEVVRQSYSNPVVRLMSGVGLDERNDSLWISYVWENSPAQKAGLQRNDVILSLNNTQISGEKEPLEIYHSVNSEIPNEDTLHLRIWRAPDEEFEVNIVRELMDMPTVFTESISEDIHIIQITQFRRTTLDWAAENGTWAEFQKALEKTSADKVTFLDLRGNPGGDVSICMAMADEIVDDEFLIQYLNKMNQWDHPNRIVQNFYGNKGGIGVGREFIILQNSRSASCSEIFTFAVQNNNLATVIGTNSYGKGIGQYLINTPQNGLVRVTAMRFQDKEGNTYHETGIEPDIFVEGSWEQLERAILEAEKITGQNNPVPQKSSQAYQLFAAHRLSVADTNDLQFEPQDWSKK